ncbi:hypothetical protein HERIO_1517 [Hepatospora eriocheir]|uniref:Uncharacterized protein n=1 Tax=Hepatospora eriocheir TaxID=1081669 RepID=A0A1X0Q9V1_9MICR|nr:hypothetical protein HERIO_1517 [Hepatospora eriocheir]
MKGCELVVPNCHDSLTIYDDENFKSELTSVCDNDNTIKKENKTKSNFSTKIDFSEKIPGKRFFIRKIN